jgi:hypothetical protein
MVAQGRLVPTCHLRLVDNIPAGCRNMVHMWCSRYPDLAVVYSHVLAAVHRPDCLAQSAISLVICLGYVVFSEANIVCMYTRGFPPIPDTGIVGRSSRGSDITVANGLYDRLGDPD